MAIDISTNKHAVAFPSRIASSAGSPHIYDIHLAKKHDNGDLVLRDVDKYIKLGTYEESATAPTFSGIVRESNVKGKHFIEVAQATDALFVYMPEISPYNERSLRDASLFYNEAGDTVKAYSLIVGDIFEVTDDKITGQISEGAKVSYADGKYVIAAGA